MTLLIDPPGAITLIALVHGSPTDRLFPSLSRLVLETLGPLPPTRKCFRMINGVLVERTVKDVTPALQTNSEGLKKVLEELVKQYKKQQDEMENWKVSMSSLKPPIQGTKAYIDTSCRRKTTYRLYSSRLMVLNSKQNNQQVVDRGCKIPTPIPHEVHGRC